MPRAGGNADVRWFDVELCYVFHPLNAYDEDERVVVDLVRHERMFATDVYGPAELPPTLDRWTVDLAAGKVVEERIDDHPQELPRLDPRVAGSRHRYGYAPHTPTFDHGAVDFGGLLKHDLDAGTTTVRHLGAGQHAGEAVFVPASETSGEDEGWLLSVVYDEGRDSSELLIVDATDFTGPEVARVSLPQRVPFGFHGSWVGDDELGV
jgi:carotenoid cleavage dioxygenase